MAKGKLTMMENWYINFEDELYIKCPYCGKSYEPSYEVYYTHNLDFYTMKQQEFICDECKKKFIIRPYFEQQRYETRTIPGEASYLWNLPMRSTE